MLHRLVYPAIAAAALVLLITVALHAQQSSRVPATGPLTPMKPHVGALPPLTPSAVLARPMSVVQSAYEFAARHPEVLQYMPCYCGCERLGHNGNHECFVKRRAADGRVLEWDPHGSGCTICIDVARDAMLMFSSGASTGAIRRAIDAKYGSRFQTRTPTPAPAAQP